MSSTTNQPAVVDEVTSDPQANLAGHQQGWTFELDKLVALLESGS